MRAQRFASLEVILDPDAVDGEAHSGVPTATLAMGAGSGTYSAQAMRPSGVSIVNGCL